MQTEGQDRYLVTSALAVDCSEVEPAAGKALWRIAAKGWESPHRFLLPPLSNW